MYHIIIYFFINIYYRHWKTLFWSKKHILTQACTLCFKIAEDERHSWWSASCYISASYLLPQHHTAQILIIISLLDFNIVREEKEDLKNRFEWYRNICMRTRPIFTKRVIERPIATASRFHKLWLFHEQQLDAALRLKLATRRTATRKLIDAQENSGGGEDGSRTRARARQDAGAYFSRGFYTRFAVSWMLYHRFHPPPPSHPCPTGKGTRSRNATLHRNAGLTLSNLAIVQQVSNVRFE